MANEGLGKKAWDIWTKGILVQVNAMLDGKFDFNGPTFYELMQSDKSQNAVNADAKAHDAKKEAKQQAWLKSKGLL